jgi:hypothetical protein
MKKIKKYFVFTISLLVIMEGSLFIYPKLLQADVELLGIISNLGKLVSFDPYSSTILKEHVQLSRLPGWNGLTYDYNRTMLYALRSDNELYSIDPNSLKISLIGILNRNGTEDRHTATALTYNSLTDTLYTVTINSNGPYDTPLGSELSKVNIDNAELTTIGNISGHIIALSFDDNDGQLYGLVYYGIGPWDSPDKAHVIRVNPENATTEILFETSYHTMGGLVKKPDRNSNIFYSWINWTTHFYGEVNLDTKTITPLGDADAVGVISAMCYKDFFVLPRWRSRTFYIQIIKKLINF